MKRRQSSILVAGLLTVAFGAGWAFNVWQPSHLSDETLRLVFTTATALFGAFIGVVGALIVGERQHERTLEAERSREARARAKESALDIDQLMDELAVDVPDQWNSRLKENSAADGSRKERIWRNLERVERLAVDLPEPWRTRVAEGQSFMKWAWEMSSDPRIGTHHHYHSTHRIAWRVNRDVHEALSSYLTSADEPPVVSDDWLMYRTAFEELMHKKEHEFAPDISEDAEIRDKWLARHPALRDELTARRTARSLEPPYSSQIRGLSLN